ncbi:hypothetical protein Aph02nite_78470 [Actinoplanes philippinensis]|uniref:Diguanylate cyclase (GGDEF) domain-containing protein n=1 Tax=Actinoplanes philippinensis TaxID=35752 RepID=A0A1I2KBX2_9ACTN|nr:bifunctional diguanylate cyclase/phosphodiesterase [Actinoplanes philippinensis]GIE81897.1 hypothetical protein Aph02nite_78470 [Actinoplanes philippinensis]SFF64474.1 diguanylate cyclase (GGDEF) domain-containing protein [Actinoplanes philippinensis]
MKGARVRPVVVAAGGMVLAVAAVPLEHHGGWVLGHLGGAVVAAAATAACRDTARSERAPRDIRDFWRLWTYSVFCLLLSMVGAGVGIAVGAGGMQVYEALPNLFSVALALLAFRHAPLGRRRTVDWLRLALDGAAVAGAGLLLCGYLVVQQAPPGADLSSRWTAGLIGVGCLLQLVVFGRAAVSPLGRVDPGALGLLAAAPLVALAAVVLFLTGSSTGMLILSVLGYPLIALAICLAAYRQSVVLARPEGTGTATRPRWSFADPVLFLTLAGSAGLVAVSARGLDPHGRRVLVGAMLITAFVVVRQMAGLRAKDEALTVIRRQQAHIERLALTDSLTGLRNRTGFGVVLDGRLETDRPATVLLIDIDDFKLVNDTIGPNAADRLLCQVAQRLEDGRGDGETVARLGGDEFAVLLPSADRAAAEAAAARLRETVGRPVVSGGQQMLLHASVGVAVAAAGETADEVLRNADIAMYAAKESGKASWAWFEPRMRLDLAGSARLAGELHNGITNGELRLLYQPVYDLVTGEMHGAEALVRWHHPVRGPVSPAEFIPVAERSGLIVPLGAWVLREACAQLAHWRRERPGAIEAVNVNVAVRQLREPGFVDEVAAVLSEHDLLPRNLIVEVTESSVADGRQVAEALQALHEMGVRLALDDFGTGQSSLSLLRSFPVDVLKLDKSFVDGISDGADRGRLAVAAAVAQLAEHLQLKAVAEGIESQAQLEVLREMGYRYGQGYLMAEPLPADRCAERFGAAGRLPVTAVSPGT